MTSSTPENSDYEDSNQEMSKNENNVQIDEFMYIQMEFCEKSTLRYYIKIILYL